MNDIIKIVKPLEDSGLLIKIVGEAMKNKKTIRWILWNVVGHIRR